MSEMTMEKWEQLLEKAKAEPTELEKLGQLLQKYLELLCLRLGILRHEGKFQYKYRCATHKVGGLLSLY